MRKPLLSSHYLSFFFYMALGGALANTRSCRAMFHSCSLRNSLHCCLLSSLLSALFFSAESRQEATVRTARKVRRTPSASTKRKKTKILANPAGMCLPLHLNETLSVTFARPAAVPKRLPKRIKKELSTSRFTTKGPSLKFLGNLL